MKFSMVSPNPVGEPSKELLALQISETIETWNQENPNPSWWSKTKGIWHKAVAFIVSAVDGFILAIDKVMMSGPDKKATVLSALGEVYDNIVPSLLPIWLRPFAPKIKSFVFDVILVLVIDFVVAKYRGGSWKNNTPVEGGS